MTATMHNAATRTAFNDFRESAKGADVILGHIVPVTVHNGDIDRTTFSDYLELVGLGRFAPRPTAPTDLFRKVSRSVNNVTVKLDDGRKVRLLDVVLVNTGDELHRRLVAELLNADNEKLSYTEMYDIKFDKEFTKITLEDCIGLWSASPEVRDVASAAVQSITPEFRRRQHTVDQDGVRGTINRALADADAVAIKDSVFFVPESHAATVAALERIAGRFPEMVRAFDIPLPDTGKQRGMIEEAATAQLITKADALLAEAAAELEKNGSLSDRRRRSLLARQKEVADSLVHYRDVLEGDMDAATTRLDFVRGQMARLF